MPGNDYGWVHSKGEYAMSEEEKLGEQKHDIGLERKGFIYTVLGGVIAAMAGWVAGVFPRNEIADSNELFYSTAEARISSLEAMVATQTSIVDSSLAGARISALETQVSLPTSEVISSSAESRISTLETMLAEQKAELMRINGIQPIAQLEGDRNQRIIFKKNELSVINPEGVLLNLVATHGPVGIRFYKDFDFGNEQETNPWHMGYIEGLEGYQSLAILRDWRFTAALWDEDGKLLLGRLDPYPPGNQPGTARFQVRGTVDEVQVIIEANRNQTADIFQVVGGDSKAHFTVNGEGNVVIGAPDEPKEVILHDTVDGSAYGLQVTNGRLVLTKT
jgi:uncharacterized coiled-coil protein SlyX